jgi:hypothetical protein
VSSDACRGCVACIASPLAALGLFAIVTAKLRAPVASSRLTRFPTDSTPRIQGAELIDFSAEDPMEANGHLTNGHVRLTASRAESRMRKDWHLFTHAFQPRWHWHLYEIG